jgi:hypothetical protein
MLHLARTEAREKRENKDASEKEKKVICDVITK